MCGIVGFCFGETENKVQVAQRMLESIRHRGPDNSGVWCDDSIPLVLGHVRLSIVDISPSGNQPMHSGCGRYVLAFNGEIYNHESLRKELEQKENTKWRGKSDTETLLACVSAWGVKEALKKVVGMFAFALWDRGERHLTLARDRLGEKPLYWGWAGNTLIFASELKAVKAYPGYKAEVDRSAIALLMRYGYIPAPHSIYAGMGKLLPGCLVRIPLEGNTAIARAAKQEQYWSVSATVTHGVEYPFQGDEREAAAQLESCLMRSINAQMVADVPVGAFLSGGVDSSLVVALMQLQSGTPVRTFTIGFDDSGHNEAEHAAAVARHLKTEHTDLYVKGTDALEVIPSLPSIYCEPFADSSQIPTFLVSQLASKEVTVALSGDGGDELFGGYNRYLAISKIWNPLQRLPQSVRRLLAVTLQKLSPSGWDKLYTLFSPLLPAAWQVSMPGEKILKLAGVLPLSDSFSFYHHLTSLWENPTGIVRNGVEPLTRLTDKSTLPQMSSIESFMMAMDAQTYLPDDILTKVDRAAMANSLETRVPMLDHSLVELAWKMPLSYKIRNGQGKWLLRQVLYRHVPRNLIERPKMGFGVPLADWLRGPLREWADSLLDEKRLQQEGYFHSAPIQTMWKEHVSGKKNWQYHLWSVLIFQGWLADQ